MKLQNKVAVVTGAGRGIGRVCALRLAALGAHVVICDIRLDSAREFGEELTAATVMDEVRALGRRAMGVEADMTDKAAVSAAPEIPTMDESGLRGYEATSWNGILAPAATPRAIVQKLNFEAVKALASSDVKEAILRMGAEPSGSTPGEFGAYLKSEVAKWTKVVRESGIKAE